jgi:hypothetical protein
MKNTTIPQRILTLAIVLILPIAALFAQTITINAPSIVTTGSPNEWTRTLPADEPFGTPPEWIAMRMAGPVEIFAPVSALSIKHPVYGYAARPGNWHWRRIDEQTRALLLGMTTPATDPDPATAAELKALKARVSDAVAVLTAPTP